MSRSLRSLAAGLPALAWGVIVTTTVLAQSSVVFRGLNHTAVGGATLSVDPSEDTLVVRTHDGRGADGVRVDLGGQATSWTARLSPQLGDTAPFNLTLAAVADGQPISTSFLRQDGGRLRIGARFTGSQQSPYAAQVYDDGRLVAAQGSVPEPAILDFWLTLCSSVPEFCELTIGFHRSVFNECLWSYATASGRNMEFVLPNGLRVSGDELRLVEEVNPAGHYPYLTFDALRLQTNAPRLTVFSETVR